MDPRNDWNVRQQNKNIQQQYMLLEIFFLISKWNLINLKLCQLIKEI